MSNEILQRDQNNIVVLGAITDDANQEIRMVRVDPATNRILASTTGIGSGSVTSVSVVSANGFAGSVATATTTPAITISTSITGILKGDGAAISAVTIGSGLSFDGTTLSASGSSDITIGTTTITSGTTTRILYNNAGVVGEYTLTGSGTVVVMATSPTLVTPVLGVATATSINGLTITTSTGTLTITNAKTLSISNTLTFVGSDSTTITFQGTDTYVGRTTTDTLTNKTLTSPSIASPTITTEWDFGAHTAGFTETDNGNSSTADTIDWRVSNKQKSTLTANCTFTFTAPTKPCSLVLKLAQDGTGSRTVTWPATVHWSGGIAPTLTTTASRIDIITFYWDGSTYFGNYSLNYVA